MDHIILHYYVLPLIGIRFKDLKKNDNYIRTYLTNDCTTVLIEFKDLEEESYSTEFVSIYIENGRFFQIYSVPDNFRSDMDLIARGKYSRISQKAKDTVMKLSGLPFNKLVNGKRVTSAPLLALNKSPELKKHQEEKLNVPMDKDAFGRTIQKVKIPDELDLFDAPTDDIYLKFEEDESE